MGGLVAELYAYTHSTMTSTENKELDPYVAKAQNDDISPILKIDGEIQ